MKTQELVALALMIGFAMASSNVCLDSDYENRDEHNPLEWTQEEEDLPANQYLLDEIDKFVVDRRKQKEDPRYALEQKKKRYRKRLELKKRIIEMQEVLVPRDTYEKSEGYKYFDEFYNDSQLWH